MNKMDAICPFFKLPEEILLIIFELCDSESLRKLSATCRKFHHLILTEDIIWREASLNVLGSNMSSPYMQKRCKPILFYRQRCKISKLWLSSDGAMTKIANFKKCMPWMALEKDFVYLSKGETLVQYQRASNGNIFLQPVLQATPCEDDISKFVVNEQEVICAGRDGRLARLNKENFHNIHTFKAHSADILAVDSKKDVIITGCRESTIKIWNAHSTNTDCRAQVHLRNRILSMAIMYSNTSFFVGTPGTKTVHPLQLFDLESCRHISNFGGNHRNGAGILCIYPESYHTALTCGYDSTLQLWDTRCSERSVKEWFEPFDTSLYCVESDHNVTILTGAACHAMFLVWDKRMIKPVKRYYTPQRDRSRYNFRNSEYMKGPIFSVTFDASHIFIALEKTLLQYSYM